MKATCIAVTRRSGWVGNNLVYEYEFALSNEDDAVSYGDLKFHCSSNEKFKVNKEYEVSIKEK